MRRVRSCNKKAKNKTNRLVITAFIVLDGKVVDKVGYYIKPWQREVAEAHGIDLKKDILEIFKKPDTSDIPEADEKWFQEAKLVEHGERPE